jgi:hypothetical protein
MKTGAFSAAAKAMCRIITGGLYAKGAQRRWGSLLKSIGWALITLAALYVVGTAISFIAGEIQIRRRERQKHRPIIKAMPRKFDFKA